jgi:hypothetical protein
MRACLRHDGVAAAARTPVRAVLSRLRRPPSQPPQEPSPDAAHACQHCPLARLAHGPRRTDLGPHARRSSQSQRSPNVFVRLCPTGRTEPDAPRRDPKTFHLATAAANVERMLQRATLSRAAPGRCLESDAQRRDPKTFHLATKNRGPKYPAG